MRGRTALEKGFGKEVFRFYPSNGIRIGLNALEHSVIVSYLTFTSSKHYSRGRVALARGLLHGDP